MTFVTPARSVAVASALLLAVTVGGTSYAAVKIGTQQLKDNAVTGAKIKKDTVTGKDVKESSLGKVPLAGFASNADTAVRAQDAGTVDETAVKAVDAETSPDPDRPLFPYIGDDLRIEMLCTGTVAAPVVDLVATTVSGPATMFSLVVGDAAPSAADPAVNDQENDWLEPGMDFDLLAGGSGNINQVTFTYHRPGGDLVQGTLLVDTVGNSPDRSCRAHGYVLTH